MTTVYSFRYVSQVTAQMQRIKLESTNQSNLFLNLLCVSALGHVWIHCMAAQHPFFQSLVQSHSSSSPADINTNHNSQKQLNCQNTPLLQDKKVKVSENCRETFNSATSSPLHSFGVHYSFYTTDHLQEEGGKKKINRLFTSSWIFFSFSFCSELETGFDLLPSKLMYKPPSSFTLRPGSIRLDNSFLKLIGTGIKIPQEEQSCLISHLCTGIIKSNDVSEHRGSTVCMLTSRKD